MTIDSRVPGFYKLSPSARRTELALRSSRSVADVDAALAPLSIDVADKMIENVVGTYALPFAIGLNVRINGVDRWVPMVVEEPSVVAAMSNAAKMARDGGGFHAEADPPITTAQIQFWDVHAKDAATRVVGKKDDLLAAANRAFPDIVKFGGGAKDLEAFDRGEGLFVVHLHVDVRDAMGANMVNTMAEAISGDIHAIVGGTPGLRILTNLADRRTVTVTCDVPVDSLRTADLEGAEVAKKIELASRFAERDPYRAVTHNKGIMNGIDPVVIATGNDWRAVEAGAHCYASKSGVYRPLATWAVAPDGATLRGRIQLPMALGIVGGTIRVHPTARFAFELTEVKTASELGMIAAAAGLASNLAALRALATEGIQRGHMTLHARSVAASAGATADEIGAVAAAIVKARSITKETAERCLAELRSKG